MHWKIVSRIGRKVWAPRVTNRQAAESKAAHLNETVQFANPADCWVVEPADPEPEGRS